MWVPRGDDREKCVHSNLDIKQYTLPEYGVPDGVVDEINNRLTGMDREIIGKPRGLVANGAKLSGGNDFTTLGAGFRNKPKDTVTRLEYSLEFRGRGAKIEAGR